MICRLLFTNLIRSLKVGRAMSVVTDDGLKGTVESDSLKRKPDEEGSDAENEAKKIKLEQASEPSEKQVDVTKTNKFRKPKKAVILLCYQGKDYYGMQRNHSVRTIETDLLQALLKAGIILQEECDFPKNMKFQRAARTDKGVSAVRQIVSLKIPLKEISENFPSKVNQFLPPEIKVLSIKRVTQTFDAKIACDARTYSYMIPTFAFCDSAEPTSEDYRIPNERLTEVNEFLKNYIGTHNFYNFTSGRLPNDASCKRFIISCECGSPFIKEGLEFVIIKIKGQSFMLHQIRKMVGLTISVVRKLVSPSEMLGKVWKNERVDIPKAPGLGLILEEVHYDWYNKKYGGDGMHEMLTWNDVQEAINQFREEEIYKNIAVTERREKSMMQWLQTLPHHTFDFREPQPPEKVSANDGQKADESDTEN